MVIETPPDKDQIEISVFGPGYGESILAHLGNGCWIVIDSCTVPRTGQSAPIDYLARIGVDVGAAVKLIVASHWHDDHIRGLAQIVRASPTAAFSCSGALLKREFFAVVTRYEERNTIESRSGVREIFEVFDCLRANKKQARYAGPNVPLLDLRTTENVSVAPCRVTSLSPSHKQAENFWTEIAELVPQLNQTRRRAITPSPNNVAIALWIEVGTEKILLGSDLEEIGDPECGWQVIAKSPLRPTGKARIIKLPHHGAFSAHSDEMWSEMVESDGVYAVLTPFIKGDVILPAKTDVARILKLAPQAYSTAPVTSRAVARRSSEVERQIRATVGRLRLAEPRMGHVQMRKRPGEDWTVALSSLAQPLTKLYV